MGAISNFRIAAVALVLATAAGCGTNTEKPVYPYMMLLSRPSPPTIIEVKPVEVKDLDGIPHIEFDLNYYITNHEDDFIGYNLYISTVTVSPDSDESGGLYLPEGKEPSFPHVSDQPDTSSQAMVTQRLTHLKAPPVGMPFSQCELYYFRLAAVFSHSQSSGHSIQDSACAAVDPAQCPKGSGCKP